MGHENQAPQQPARGNGRGGIPNAPVAPAIPIDPAMAPIVDDDDDFGLGGMDVDEVEEVASASVPRPTGASGDSPQQHTIASYTQHLPPCRCLPALVFLRGHRGKAPASSD